MLILTKLQRPRVADDFVARDRLLKRLERGRSRKLTLISAPAGYGKSSLAASWIELVDTPSVWYSVESSDRDVTRFVEYLFAGIDERVPGSCPRIRALLQAAEPPPLSVFEASLVNDLAEIDTPVIIVLDDYQRVEGSESAHLVAFLLEYLPENVHIIVITRQDPNLSLVRLQANQQMLAIRSADLRFTLEEASTFLARSLEVRPSDDALRFLAEKTEGWIVGLRLVGLSLSGRNNVEEFSRNLGSQGGLLADYLLLEVLSHATPELQQFLLRSSICDRFSAQLCDEFLDDAGGDHRSADHIDTLVRTNLFLISLDSSGTWWRYHHLLQDLLQHQLHRQHSSQDISELHRRASKWFARNGLLDDAFSHAVNAGDLEAAADIVEENRIPMMNLDRWLAVEFWLKQLPDAIRTRRPGLLVVECWIAYYRHALSSLPSLVARILAILEDRGDDPLRGEVDFFRALGPFWQGDTEAALALLRSALETIPASYHQARGEAELYLGLSIQMSGQRGTAARTLNRLLYDGDKVPAIRQTRLWGSLIFVDLLSGDLSEALRNTLRVREAAAASNSAYATTWSWYLEGLVHFFRFELVEAAECFRQAVDNRYVLHVRAAIDSLAGQTLTFHFLGQDELATASLQELLDFAHETNDLTYLLIARSCEARLASLRETGRSSQSWLRTADLAFDAGIMFYFIEIPRVTACRILAGQRSRADLQDSLDTLERYFEENEAVHNVRQMIEVSALQAVVLAKLDRTDEALDVLKRAVELAEPGGWVLPFVEYGETMCALFEDIELHAPGDAFVARILSAFPSSKSTSTFGSHTQALEVLTGRELEVLELLAQRYRDKEIAEELVISPTTVKRHASNIYQKLHVNNRRQAVAVATSMGILSPGDRS